MTIFYDSGLYREPFFTKHRLILDDNNFDYLLDNCFMQEHVAELS